MRFNLFFPSLILGGFTIVSPARSQPLAEEIYSTVFLREAKGEKQWEVMPISKRASPGTLSLIPPVEGAFGMVSLRCEDLSRDGALRNCTVETEPTSDAYTRVGKALSSDLRTDRTFAKAVRDNIRFISIQVRVSNSASNLTAGPCWPPSCHPMPLPPPPPGM